MRTKTNKTAQEVIDTLNNGNFYCECPCGCGEEIKLKDADLFYMDNFSPAGKEAQRQLLEDLKQQRLDLRQRQTDMNQRPQVAAKAVNVGFILERIAPAFDNFPFEHNDCRSLFDPIDYVIFEGLNRSGLVNKIFFTDIKTGSAKLNNTQKTIRNLVKEKQVNFKKY